MNISVECKDTNGTISAQTHNLSQLAFAKHLAIAGQGYAPSPQKLMRTVAMFLHYSCYMQRRAFNNDRFSEPPVALSDPTEKGQFSNLAGKAIADFLSKKIDKSLYTVNYEAAMRLSGIPLSRNGRQVRRPDLLAFSRSSMFAIEAKGFSGSYGDMSKHKAQSSTGGIKVNYTVASVSYDLYNQVKCKYHDPFNNNVQFDNKLLANLTKNYYKGLSKYLDGKFFDYRELNFGGEQFFEIELSYRSFERLFAYRFPMRPFWQFEVFDFYRPRLILLKEIRSLAETGITNEIRPFLFAGNEQRDDIYIDNDRVGLAIRF